jgi:hypothetical protein
MLFAIIGKLKVPAKQAIARRMNWKYPTGMRVVGEYWVNGNDTTLIVIAEAENDGALLSYRADWDDDFEIAIYPAMTAERGLQLAKQLAA